MPPKRILDGGMTPRKAAKLQRTARMIHDGGVSEGTLCSQCRKLDLSAMFSKETNAKDFGFLEHFMDATCPFCTIIWDCIRLHWGSASPLANGARPRLYIQSKEWSSFSVDGDTVGTHRIYRILLAVTKQPPKFSFNRRVVPTDKQNRFIIGEIEMIEETTIGQTPAPQLRRKVGSFFDIDQLRGWLQICQDHKHNSTLDHNFFGGGLRLIDVLEARLVEVTEPCDYIALSYVWGPHDPYGLRTVKKNLNRLETLHALSATTRSVGRRIPRTITDAMELCKASSYRFLWVDCLCIVQDDEMEKQRLIHGMNHVYENASLTLIAACGEDADAGLAGIRARGYQIHEKRYTIQLPNTLLSVSIAPISLEEQVRKSHWNTRAWTLQEASLSTRRLYVTSDEVFFECQQDMWRESYATEGLKDCVWRKSSPFWGRASRTGVDVPLAEVLPRGSGKPWTSEMYAEIVSNYSRRNLSYSEDIFNAFSGIYQRCTSTQPSPRSMIAVQGLNSASLARSLLWFIADHNTSKAKRRSVAHGITLAGWSWASWTAPVDFVCMTDTSFPAPRHENFHFNFLHYHLFVSEWGLISKEGKNISKFTIVEPPPPSSIAIFQSVDDLTYTHILTMLSTKPSLQEISDKIGSLSFVAPSITVSHNFDLVIDAKISDGGHLLMLHGLKEHFSIIKFDSDDQNLTELVLILFDGCFVALCVRTEGQISRRIGVAQLSRIKSRWEHGLTSGFLKIQWKQMCLI
ncbi:heterokaryon incompatibility protein-domain-containing protein [Phaeosphaeria sp. MPI-PUGE-AT-0046c]|nr:heterokaryon incompatibility protein-domain-containing protein [Phaeosphaeria sp. MPI-PUGE-AT-0046c]